MNINEARDLYDGNLDRTQNPDTVRADLAASGETYEQFAVKIVADIRESDAAAEWENPDRIFQDIETAIIMVLTDPNQH